MPSTTSDASSGTLRLTSASAIGPSSWWRALLPTNPTALSPDRTSAPAVGNRFEQLDTDKDGALSREEFEKGVNPQAK